MAQISQDFKDSVLSLIDELITVVFMFRQRIRQGFHPEFNEFRDEIEKCFEKIDNTVRDSDDARLKTLFNSKKSQSENIGKYILAAFVDDIACGAQPKWEHSDKWLKNTLEFMFFDTYVAGDDIPDIISDINEYEDKNTVAELLFAALALGYQGKLPEYFDDVDRKISDLYHLMPDQNKVTSNVSSNGQKFIPQAYENIEAGKSKKLISIFTLFWTIFWCLMFVVVFIGVFFYYQHLNAKAFHDAVDRILMNYVSS